MNNESAIKFYEKFGFEIVEEKKNYYKRIEPADAYVLQKSFRNTDDKSAEKKSTTNVKDEMQKVDWCSDV